MNQINNLLIFIFIFFVSAATANAQSIPNFPACPNPGGELIASYDSGIHGIPGDSTTYTGSDKVFKLNDAMIVQCLCPDNGSGIQTLWWKNPGLSADEASVVVKQGWIRIPNGSLWGLDDAEYFAKNSNFSCAGQGGSVNGASTSSSNGGGSSSSSDSQGEVSSTGQVLGATVLAATGNWSTIAAVFALALIATFAARAFRQTA